MNFYNSAVSPQVAACNCYLRCYLSQKYASGSLINSRELLLNASYSISKQ